MLCKTRHYFYHFALLLLIVFLLLLLLQWGLTERLPLLWLIEVDVGLKLIHFWEQNQGSIKGKLRGCFPLVGKGSPL